MAISPICDVVNCRKELREFGGIVLSPPDPKDARVRKIHVCQDCYEQLAAMIDFTGLYRN